jgi:hypothetical protein
MREDDSDGFGLRRPRDRETIPKTLTLTDQEQIQQKAEEEEGNCITVDLLILTQ